MIPRYSREKMAQIWSPEHRYRKWLDIEILACEAMNKLGLVPDHSLRVIKEKAGFDVARIDEIERTTKHDVIAFLTSVTEKVGPDGRFIHMGLTSSDILDTSLACLLREAADILLEDLDALLAVLKRCAREHKHTIMIGRSHGIHAEPITWGLKLANWYGEMRRNRERLLRAREVVSAGKIAGAVGTFSFIDPFVEEYVCARLGLQPAPVSSQIVQRDRHAEYFAVLAIIASSLDKFAQEIRLLQRTEVREAEEYFSPGQKGSSAMPHKRNPVLSENISGLARLIRSYAVAALEDIPLWHERDISHSSVERVIGPDATILLDFMLVRFTGMMDKLVVYPERMLANLQMTHGVIYSQMVLLKLIAKGMTREDAYALVQRQAMRAWEEGREFRELLLADPQARSFLDEREIADLFRTENFLGRVDFIFRRVFGAEEENVLAAD
ncbi:MAG TPA: adenylosuccinate lyase [Syntrophales bacterium]|jgi:adenylosuccinate lyase|nr:adenylosuccinate lyase [Syntrophales bacterium]HOU76520.1 adenylosuccinate lyase [Syntrophales bacterium]HPC32457.1 adenylosuccinate lyase [Syntrophales bacterium]HQG33850.1 adenylosuccinate lyase [Syntrophales bacterium]HQI35148.1 adenylosuccinate lyase [Syntrophales bacterium]